MLKNCCRNRFFKYKTKINFYGKKKKKIITKIAKASAHEK